MLRADNHPGGTALSAQRLVALCAFGLAPALATGLMAGSHTHSRGDAAIVFFAVFLVSQVMQREHIPLNLMPLASLLVRAAVPVLGLTLALVVLGFAGRPEPASTMAVPLVGAWIVTLIGAWLSVWFENSRQVRVAVIGSPTLAVGLAQELESAGVRSHRVVGWLNDYGASEARTTGGERLHRLGSLDDVREIVEDRSIELLIYASGDTAGGQGQSRSRLELFDRIADACLDLPVRLLEAARLYEDLLGHVPLGQSNSAWFQYILHPNYRAGSLASKRVFDLVVGGLMLVAFSPVLAVFAMAVKMTDGGPIFYRQRRVGEGGREFAMIKLRSMRVDSEAVGARWSVADDDRVTAVGRIMRHLHIDEMPQLWNVLRGEMTVVGPRPERREIITELERRLAYYDRRHLVKPGLAGWAQARCGYSGSEEGTSWKLCHDLFYLKHRSVYFDSLILLENVRVSLKRSVQFGIRTPQEQFIFGQIHQAQ